MKIFKLAKKTFDRFLILGMPIFLIMAGCVATSPAIESTISLASSTPASEVTRETTIENTSPYSETRFTTPTHEPTPFIEPVECLAPPEDYDLFNINGRWLNQRTLSMLEYAQSLYQGEIEITGYAITQGSFNDNGAASFGTHLGGGAVDLSVMRTQTYTVLYDEIPDLLRALRLAGFAAWLREPDEVYSGSAIHIHAIAIGDRDLSEAAKEQLTGEAGYFRGFSGLPAVNGTPTPDRYGGPVICQWMLEAGYEDLRPTPVYDDQDLPKKCLCD